VPKRVFAGIMLAVAVLIVSASLAYHNTLVLREYDRQTDRSYQALSELQATLLAVTEAETGERGYVITGDPEYLKPYEKGRHEYPEAIDRLRTLLGENTQQHRNLANFRTAIDLKFEQLDRSVSLRRDQGFEPARQEVSNHRGRELMEQIRNLAAQIEQGERQRLRQRSDQEASAATTLIATFIGTSILAGALLVVVWLLLQFDVRQRQRAADTLFRERERLRVTLSSIGDAVIVTDGYGTITFINPIAEKLTAWPQEQAVGRPLTDVFRIIDESTRKNAESPIVKVLRQGSITSRTNHTLLLGRDGTERPIDDSVAPIQDREGGLVGVVLVFRDVTERRRSQRQLEERLAEIEALMEVMPVAVWQAHDPNCRRIMGNRVANELLGLPPGTNSSARPPSGEIPLSLRYFRKDVELSPEALPMQRAAATGQPVRDSEVEVRLADGTLKTLYGSAIPLFDAAGAVRGGVAAFLDITDRKRLEEELHLRVEQLAESDRRKDEFLAMLAHELRNPLAPIRTALEVLRRRGGEAFTDDLGEMMERQVRHVVRLVDDLLDVSRITRGKIELRRESVDLTAAVRRAVEAARATLDERQHQLEIKLPERPVWIDADPARLEQVLANLLANAAKYTPPGGRIGVTVEVAGNEAIFRVQDNGIGISSDMVARIFDLFQQGDRVPGRVSEGLGIGLTLVQRLVQMHGGSIEAESPGVGQGSTFTVRLPLGEAPSAPIAAQMTTEPELRSLHVLVCDDNIDAAESLATLLRLMGHTAHTTHDGPTALAVACEQHADVALLDIGLPRGMDGYELARRIREEGKQPVPMLVALTGFGQDEDRQRATAAGFDVHLVKPAAPEAILDLLRSVAESR
jgi:PAS domain S-box-containing protein